VIRKKGETLDVRFFGGYHQKATVEKGHVKPITVNVHTLQVKRTSLWNKACEELRKHQELLAKYEHDEEFHAEPYGNHFVVATDDARSQWAMGFGSGGADDEAHESDDDEGGEADGGGKEAGTPTKSESKKGKTSKRESALPSQAVTTPQTTESPASDKKKKKGGKGKKPKKVRK
jgi:hypothetical protein